MFRLLGGLRMMGPLIDSRVVMPTAEHWALSGGAYRDGNQIVLPSVGSGTSCWLPVRGGVRYLYWTPKQVLIPAPGAFYRQANYRQADRKTLATPLYPAAGAAHAPSTVGVWGPIATFTLPPGPAVYWVNVSVAVTAAYGVPGTRFIPGPADLGIAYL